MPFWQPRGLKSGTVWLVWGKMAFCSSRQTMPSFTNRFSEQAEMQSARLQVPLTTRSQRQARRYRSCHVP